MIRGDLSSSPPTSLLSELTSSPAPGTGRKSPSPVVTTRKRARLDGGELDRIEPGVNKITKPAQRKAGTKPAAASAPVPASTRPTRARKAPERFAETGPAAPRKPGNSKSGSSRAVGRSFDPVFLTTNSRSRLVKADIWHLLLEPAAWASLAGEQQQTLLKMLPPTAANLALLGRADAGVDRPKELTMDSAPFRTDCAKFQLDLGLGQYSKGFQEQAGEASSQRAMGAFDAWKLEHREAWWGQKLE